MFYEKISEELIDLRNRGAVLVDVIVRFTDEDAISSFAHDCFHMHERRADLGGKPAAVGYLKTSGFDTLEQDPGVMSVEPNIKFHPMRNLRVEDDVQ